MKEDITAKWREFADACNRDSGYPHSQEAGLERSRLEKQWREECPGLEFPQVLWSNSAGKYELTGLSVSKVII